MRTVNAVGRRQAPSWPLVAWLGLVAIWARTGQAIDWSAQELEYREQVQPLLESYCLDCHVGSEAAGGLALDHFASAKSLVKERATTHKIMTRVRIGDMPPADAEAIPDADKERLAKWLDRLINDVDCGGQPNPGSVTLRRLTRYEYRYTIRDLLWVDYEEADDFPGDDVGYGFDNVGDVLNLPPLLMEKYVHAAEAISERAVALPPAGPQISNVYPLTRFKLTGGKGNVASDKIHIWSNDLFEWEETAPWDGVFHLEIVAGGTAASGIGPAIGVTLDGKSVLRQTLPADKQSTLDVRLRMKGGKHTLQVGFLNDATSERNGVKEDRNLEIRSLRFFGAKPAPPLSPADMPPSHSRIITVTPGGLVDNHQAMRQVVSPLAVYLYRRPLKDDELQSLVELAVGVVEDGEPFEAGVRVAIQAMLLSPHFLFKVEEPPPPAGNPTQMTEYPRVSDFELASRLSYFLWNSAPDRDLFTLAWRGELSKPEVLKTQMARMIADSRSARFVDSFASQWLTLRRLQNFEAAPGLFPRWNNQVRDLARQETLLFVADVFQKDRSVLELIDADYTFVNEPLAKFYGIAGVKGDAFQRVSVANQPRRGLLTHASVLAVTSNPTRTSPVKRGRFILDNILNQPPPPPPPGVPELEKTKLTGSLREQIEQHRADPNCAGCHKLMDPLGLALENFDAVGLWRTEEFGERIDASGVLPDGQTVRHAGDLIRVLRSEHGDDFARCLTEKLMTFALGRGLEYYDRCAVDKILATAAKSDYRFSSIVYGIITSDPFVRKGVRDAL